MANSLFNLSQRLFARFNMPRALQHLRREVVGVVHDYWKDGRWEKTHGVDPFEPHNNYREPKVFLDVWHAEAGEISERMWGDGYVSPADEYFTDLMLEPLNINNDTAVVDLSAGLGARMRKIASRYGVTASGWDLDKEIAARGSQLPFGSDEAGSVIAAYNPMTLVLPNEVDCVVARETIYRAQDKETFIKAIVAGCKAKARVSFTDYIINAEMSQKPAILAWKAFEKGAEPLSLVEMAEIWARAGISISVHDDQTEHYKNEIKKGLIAFTLFLSGGVRPDEPTRIAIGKCIGLWGHRVAAIDQGMKLYRFYGSR